MSRRAEPPFQAVVTGGGPAGAAVARLLALWGRSVVLLSRPASRNGGRAESLPPSIRKIFGALRVNDAVEREDFLAAEGNRAWWGGAGPTVESFPGETGWQVERNRFDSLLLDLARDAGAAVRSATVEEVELKDGHACVRARLPDKEERSDFTAPFVLDCTGRAGIVASTGLRVRSEGPRTLALVGAWRRREGWGAGQDATYTTVEAYRDGWAWSMQVDAETRYVGAMLDPELTDLAGRSGLGEAYRSEVGKTRHVRDLLDGARLLGPPRACGATPYWSKRSSGEGFLLVGDASSFIDPLSSYGVKKALASAWLAAVVVNTLLDRPSMEEPALRFFDAREREAYWSFGSEAATLYEEAAEAHAHPFWTRRARWSDSISHEDGTIGADGEEIEPDVEVLRRDPHVRRAFQALKEAPTVRLRIREPLETVKAPVVRERELFLHDRLVTPSFPQGLRYLRGVDLLLLCRLAMTLPNDEADVPGMLERCQQHTSARIELPDFLGALSFLLAEGILENGAEPWPQSKRGVMALS